MGTTRAGLPFMVSVEAGFAENGIWTIDARLRFRDGITPPVGSRVLGEGRLALLEVIHREGLRGRALGANRVRIRLDSGDGPVDLSPDDSIPDMGSDN